MPEKKNTHIAIVGGGVSGVLAATRLANDFMKHHRDANGPTLEITIIDPRPKLGGPLYNTESINAFLAQPMGEIELPRLKRNSKTSLHGKKSDQVSYKDYGDYMRQHLNDLCHDIEKRHAPVKIHMEAGEGGQAVPYLRDEVTDAAVKDGHAVLKLKSGKTLNADAVVLATGNPLPENLRDSEGRLLERQAGYYRCYQEGLSPEHLNETQSMVLLGMGASAHTFATSAVRNGYTGHILMVSRRGKSPECEPPPKPHVMPARHYEFQHFTLANLQAIKEKKGDVTAEEFWALFEKETHRAAPMGFKRREIADLAFENFNDMNRVMSIRERTRFAEKFGADWNFMTNRIPEVHRAVLGDMCTAGRIDYREKVKSIDPVAGGGFIIRFGDGMEPPFVVTPKIVNCTGPSVRIKDMSPLLASMQQTGLVVEHPLAGINLDEGLRVKDLNGQPSKIFYALGPLAQGEFFESVSIPAIKMCSGILLESITKDHGLGPDGHMSGAGYEGPLGSRLQKKSGNNR